MGNKIKGDTNVSEDSAFREGIFTINGKSLAVPLQALDLRKYSGSKISFVSEEIGVFEISKTYDLNKLKKMKQFPEEEARDRNEIIRIKSSVSGDVPCFLFIRYFGTEYPDEDGIKKLIGISYTFSDATPLPVFPDIFREEKISRKSNGQVIKEFKPNITEDKFKKYLSFLEKYISLLNDLNHRDILGSIPINIGTSHIRELLKFYYEKGINHFYLDMNTATFNKLILGDIMYSVLSEIKRLGLEYQKTFVYCINGSSGRFAKGSMVVGSKDILTGGAGVDCIGRLHIGGGGNGKKITDLRVIEKMKLNRIRLFNKEDYGYYRLETKSLPFQLPRDNIINKDLLLDLDKGKKFSDIFNMQQLTIENKKIREEIIENFRPLSKIEKEKKNVSRLDLKSLQKFRTEKIRSLI